MEEAEKELERRSKFLNSLIQKKKAIEQQQEKHVDNDDSRRLKVHVRACDMPLPLQNHAFQCARHHLDSMLPKKLDSKRLALALKKVTTFFFLFSFIFWESFSFSQKSVSGF